MFIMFCAYEWQTIGLSILNERINNKVSCVDTQQRATVSPQFYYNVLGTVKHLYIYVLLL
jgi:hypothetical protein